MPGVLGLGWVSRGYEPWFTTIIFFVRTYKNGLLLLYCLLSCWQLIGIHDGSVYSDKNYSVIYHGEGLRCKRTFMSALALLTWSWTAAFVDLSVNVTVLDCRLGRGGKGGGSGFDIGFFWLRRFGQIDSRSPRGTPPNFGYIHFLIPFLLFALANVEWMHVMNCRCACVSKHLVLAEANWFEVRRSRVAEDEDSGKRIDGCCRRLKIHIKSRLTSLLCEWWSRQQCESNEKNEKDGDCGPSWWVIDVSMPWWLNEEKKEEESGRADRKAL